MTYTAIFQTSSGQLSTLTLDESHNKDVAWKNIHATRDNQESCLILLVPGIHIVYRHEDLFKDAE
tara:strand:- start:346 stop:540 length:195 start_codon:yes stop_codon:yes gene_type:complete